EAIYGTQTGAYESATLRLSAAAASASAAVSEAIYGTTTTKGTIDTVTSSASSIVAENAAAAASAVGDAANAVYQYGEDAIRHAKELEESGYARVAELVEEDR